MLNRRSLETVSADIACLFESTARDLLEDNDPVGILSKALALVSGNTEVTSRSLLSAQKGYTTFLIRQNWELRGTGLIWKMLNENYAEEVVSEVRGMRLCKDRQVCTEITLSMHQMEARSFVPQADNRKGTFKNMSCLSNRRTPMNYGILEEVV